MDILDFRDYTAPATTSARSLDAVLTRLAASPHVEGIVTVGSTADGPLTPTSDYDVFVAVASDSPPLDLALTVVDGRVAEFYFFALAFVERAAAEIAATTTTGDTWAGSIAPRLATGNLVFDRHGRLAAARETIRMASPLVPYAAGVPYAAWFKVNYNLIQTRRMSRSEDPVYHAAVNYRLLYSLAELWTAYCAVRGLAWRGEKEFVRHATAHDPDYLARFGECVAETDRERKLALYAALAQHTLAPVGGLWAEGATAVGAPNQPDGVPDALAYWQRMLAGDGAGKEGV